MMTDWQAIRSKFPVCSTTTYLNAAGGSPMCVDASVEGKKYFDEMLLFGDACWEEWLKRTDQVRVKLADFLGAGTQEVAFAPNTSLAMGFIASMMRLQGAVLTMDDEFPSSTIPWINLGHTVDFVPSEKGTYSLNHIEKYLRPEHKILVTSMIQYKTGFRQDLKALGQFCKSANLIFVVNATQGFGIFPVDVVDCQVDFLVFSGLKWACAGYGAAGLFISSRHLSPMKLPFAGWRSVQEPGNMNNRHYELNAAASVLESGSPSFPAIFALGGALGFMSSIGSEACLNRVLHLSRFLEDQLRRNGFPVLYTFSDAHRSGIVMLRAAQANRLVEELARKNIQVSARGEGLRISVNIYNNEEDINRLISALQELSSLL
jgi:cysteine desulfurase / selenocysteine lyase